MNDPDARFAQAVKGSDVAPRPPVSIGVALNTRAVGYAGMATGGTGLGLILTAVWRLFSVLSDPQTLYDLIGEHSSHTFGHATASVTACLIGVLGSVVLTSLGLFAAWLSRPPTIPKGT